MVEKEGRQASIPRGKAQNTAPARRKGTFYLWLAAWWPTVAGRKRWARKGVERRLRAFEESQNCAANVHSFPQGNARRTHNKPQGNARYAIANAWGMHDVLLEREKMYRYPTEENCGGIH